MDSSILNEGLEAGARNTPYHEKGRKQ